MKQTPRSETNITSIAKERWNLQNTLKIVDIIWNDFKS